MNRVENGYVVIPVEHLESLNCDRLVVTLLRHYMNEQDTGYVNREFIDAVLHTQPKKEDE